MQITRRAGAVTAGLAAFTLIACDAQQATTETSFQKQYLSARNALEAGQYDRAQRGYEKLMPRSGPLEARLRLEYAHALLRAGENAAAVQHADRLAQSHKGTARSAALAVRGTAEHEIAMKILSEGDTAAGKSLLIRAKAALAEVLEDDPALDPVGGLAGRQADIDVRLKSL